MLNGANWLRTTLYCSIYRYIYIAIYSFTLFLLVMFVCISIAVYYTVNIEFCAIEQWLKTNATYYVLFSILHKSFSFQVCCNYETSHSNTRP